METTAPPKRRWLRFGIRSLLAMMVVVAVPLAWKINQVHYERSTVAAVRNLGGGVRYDYEFRARQTKPPGPPVPPGPEWMRKYLGDDFFAHVQSVDFLSSPDEGAGVAAVLPRVRGLPDLRGLVVVLPSDEGLDQIQGIDSLVYLSLQGPFTDRGFAFVKDLPKLKKLDLIDTRITPRGLEPLRGFPNLRNLSILGDMNDEGVRAILELAPRLDNLSVKSNALTDAGLESLAKFPGRYLVVESESVTYEAAQRLQKALPNVEQFLFYGAPGAPSITGP